ncbi:MAG: ABC transporter ATP-binding protein [Chloroflexi bacterium]|nr:ABC transporter ATP-binding protein [Chloroflexota bacterium]
MRNGSAVAPAPARRDTAHLTIVYRPGSYAEQHQDELARAAESALARILGKLKIPGEALLRPHRITVVGGDAIPDPGRPDRVSYAGTTSDLGADVVTTVFTAAAPGIGLAEHLARVVLHRMMASVPSDVTRHDAQIGTAEVQAFFIHGTARYLADVTAPGNRGRASGAEAAEASCVDEATRNGWRLPLYEAMMRGPAAGVGPDLYAALQEAFSGYLVERDGIREFLRFLAGTRADPNHSAEVIYGKTLELLEAEWVSHLRGGVGRRSLSLWGFLVRVWPYLKPYPWRQVECLALMIVGSISTQVAPYQIRNLIDLLGTNEVKANPWEVGLPQVLWILLIMTLAALVNICSIVRLVYVVNILGQNVLRDMRLAYIDKVNALGAGYFARIRTGDLMARFTSDMSRLADPLARTVAYSTYYLILLVITFFGLIGLSWQLTLVLLVVVPSYIGISRLLGPPIQRANRGRQERLAQINSHLEEMVIAHPIVQIFNLQRFLRHRVHPEIHEFRRVEIRSDFLRSIFEEASDIADLVHVRLVLLIGGVLVLAQYDPNVAAVIGATTIGTVVGFNTLMGRFVLPVHRLANIYASVAIAAAALRRIEEVLKQDSEPYAVPAGGEPEPPAVREGVSIQNVSFAYATTPTLEDVSVEIPAGSSAAFVGPTGAGKTTLVNMIPRFYEPHSGVVRIDGRDVREFALPALRGQIGMVAQETYLFNATIRDNIVMGKLGATDAEIVAAARAARVHDFIMTLPAGYDTVIGERGGRLSGGQRQRLAIARALLRDAPILILDEATSALDAETEHEILEELAGVTKGKTVISITHRLALAMRCDVIYVLDAGRIVEHGTHQELLASDGLYRKLFEDQNESLLQSGLFPTTGMTSHEVVVAVGAGSAADIEPFAAGGAS